MARVRWWGYGTVAVAVWVGWSLSLGAALGLAAPVLLKVAVVEALPLSSLDPAGRPSGFALEVLQRVAEAEGWTLGWVPAGAEPVGALESGAADVVAVLQPSDELASRADVGLEPVASTWGRLVARDGVAVGGFLDLEGRAVAVARGDPDGEEFRRLAAGFGLACRVIEAVDAASVLAEVRAARADGGVIGRFVRPGPGALAETPLVFNPRSLRFAFARGRGAVRAAVDRRLAAWKADPGSPWHEARRRWLEPVADRGWAWIMPWLSVAGVVGLAFSFLLVLVAARRETLDGGVERRRSDRRHDERRRSDRRLGSRRAADGAPDGGGR